MKRIVMALTLGLLLSLTACKGGDGGSVSCGSKDLFSSWTEVGNTYLLDFSGGQFNQNYATSFDFGGGATCNFDIQATGSQCTGTMTITNSMWNGVGSDPGCAVLDDVYGYTKNSNGLSICENGSCDNFN